QIFIARAFQPALGPYGRHLSRFEPSRIVLQGLGLLKLTEVTSRRFRLSIDFWGHREPLQPILAPRLLVTCHWLQVQTGSRRNPCAPFVGAEGRDVQGSE